MAASRNDTACVVMANFFTGLTSFECLTLRNRNDLDTLTQVRLRCRDLGGTNSQNRVATPAR